MENVARSCVGAGSRSVVSKLLGSCAWLGYRVRARGNLRSLHVKARGKIPGPIEYNASFVRLGRIGCGLQTSPMCEPARVLRIRHSLRMCSPERLWVGRCRIRCAFQVLPLQALNQAITSAKETSAVIHHSNHGSQYVSVVYNERLTNAWYHTIDRNGWRFLR